LNRPSEFPPQRLLDNSSLNSSRKLRDIADSEMKASFFVFDFFRHTSNVAADHGPPMEKRLLDHQWGVLPPNRRENYPIYICHDVGEIRVLVSAEELDPIFDPFVEAVNLFAVRGLLVFEIRSVNLDKYFLSDLLRKEVDRNLDGAIDEIQIHEAGELRARHLDTDYNGRIDVQEHYHDAVMSFREVDRDQDGVLDGFYVYQQGLLVEERHDTDNDTHPDRVLVYRDRLRVEERVDDDLDGRIDIWRHFDTASGAPIVVRVERDTRGRGWPDTFESFDTVAGEPILSRREEDVNGDRHVDVVSVYRQGRLVRREILDPAAADL